MLSTIRHTHFFEMIAIKKNRIIRKNVSNLSSYSFDDFKKSLHSDEYRDFVIMKHNNDDDFEHPINMVFSQVRLRELGLYKEGIK